MDKIKHSFNSIASKQGSYSVGLTALVIAIVVLINLIVGQLPSQVRQIDISTNNIYEITDTSRELLDGLLHEKAFTAWAKHSLMIWELPETSFQLKVFPPEWRVQTIKQFGGARFLYVTGA